MIVTHFEALTLRCLKMLICIAFTNAHFELYVLLIIRRDLKKALSLGNPEIKKKEILAVR